MGDDGDALGVGRFTVADITIRLHYYKQHVNNLLRFQSPEPAVYGVTDSVRAW